MRGIFFRDQAQALHKAGLQVGVLAIPQVISKKLLLSPKNWTNLRSRQTAYDDSGVPTYQTALWTWAINQFHGAYINELYGTLNQMYSEYREKYGTPDLIHAHNSLYGGFLGTLLKEDHASLPMVLTEHSSAFITRSLPARQKACARAALSSSERVLAVSPALARALVEFEPSCTVSVLGPIVDTDFFNLPERQPPQSPFVFSAIGSLKKLKNFELLIRAFGRAFPYGKVSLRIAGTGDQKKRLEVLVSRLG